MSDKSTIEGQGWWCQWWIGDRGIISSHTRQSSQRAHSNFLCEAGASDSEQSRATTCEILPTATRSTRIRSARSKVSRLNPACCVSRRHGRTTRASCRQGGLLCSLLVPPPRSPLVLSAGRSRVSSGRQTATCNQSASQGRRLLGRPRHPGADAGGGGRLTLHNAIASRAEKNYFVLNVAPASCYHHHSTARFSF